jgi:Na+(H+)/acetate symporter ActP
MRWLETALALLAASALLVSLVFGVFLLRRSDYAALAGVLQGLAAALAVVAALTLATRDRQFSAQRFEQQTDNERAAFNRRRTYQEAARLLLLVEEDR